jgi:hypothetical protein
MVAICGYLSLSRKDPKADPVISIIKIASRETLMPTTDLLPSRNCNYLIRE